MGENRSKCTIIRLGLGDCKVSIFCL